MGKELRSAHIHLDPGGALKFHLKLGNIQQTGLRRGVDEEVQIAIFGIFPVNDLAEQTRVLHAGSQYYPAYLVAMPIKNLGRFHAIHLTGNLPCIQ